MPKRIVIIQGHPDDTVPHLCHALANAYTVGAKKAGHEVRVVQVSKLEFPILLSQEDWEKGDMPVGLISVHEAIFWADHMVIIYPLWLGSMPALLKGFFEQVFRPNLTDSGEKKALDWRKLLKGKSARIIVTMGMPALFYRLFYQAHSLKAFKRNILAFVGLNPIHTTVIGLVEKLNQSKAKRWFAKLEKLGEKAR